MGQAIYNRRRRNVALFMGLSTCAGVFPLLFVINADYQAVPHLAIAFVAFLAGCVVRQQRESVPLLSFSHGRFLTGFF